MLVGRLMEILDGCFVDEGADTAVSHFDGVDVVPLDDPLDVVSALQHENHMGLGVHLLLQIKSFGVGAFRAPICRLGLLVDQQWGIAPGIRSALFHALGKTWPDKFAGA